MLRWERLTLVTGPEMDLLDVLGLESVEQRGKREGNTETFTEVSGPPGSEGRY